MRDFSNSLMNQVGVLKGEKELTNVFIECYMTMLLDQRRIEQLKKEVDKALDHKDEKTFIELTNEINQIQKEMLAFQ